MAMQEENKLNPKIWWIRSCKYESPTILHVQESPLEHKQECCSCIPVIEKSAYDVVVNERDAALKLVSNMRKIRIITADEVAKNLNSIVGPTQIGKVLWYDSRDAIGVISTDDGREYTFSMGYFGHIGVSKPNYVVNSLGYVLKGQLVRFEPVESLACNIRDFLDK